jgi:hypothetical protein
MHGHLAGKRLPGRLGLLAGSAYWLARSIGCPGRDTGRILPARVVDQVQEMEEHLVAWVVEIP